MENDNKNKKSESALREERVLEFWKENNVFDKTLEKKSPNGEFVFYEGPPTANGKPGIHHLEARAFKDAVPRYKTMQGYHVRRKGGWDTHGLPVELQVEKALGLKSKKEIEQYGISKFNEKCKESVWEYVDIWDKFTERVGYWVDEKNPYVTYHNDYIESVWNVLKKVDEQGLLYKDYKVVPWCPRCGTALSSHELAQGYQNDKDLSVYVKFKLLPKQENSVALPASGLRHDQNFPASDLPAYILAWTTTPWTLPGNVGLAVGGKIEYVKIKKEKEILILAKERLSIIDGEHEILETFKGEKLVGLEYEPLYPFLKTLDKGDEKLSNAYKVYEADFVNTEDGTGVVHTAVMYGQDDFELGTKVGLPKFHTVDEAGHFVDGAGFLEGRFVKDEDVAVDIIKDLAHRGLLFKKEKYEHSYPHCWRCKTALIYYARDSWYIRMSDPKIKEKLINENKDINWEPDHIREGRFGEWLKDIKDWAISRERYWGTPLPIWETEDKKRIVIDSIDTLKKYTKKSGNKYFIMRHGEAGNNVNKTFTLDSQHNSSLTEKGKREVLDSIAKFKEKVDIIVSSPFDRARQTTEIVCEKLGFPLAKVIFDRACQEWEVSSVFENKDKGLMVDFYQRDYAQSPFENFKDGESFAQLVKRMGDFIYDLEQKYQNKNIMIVGHDGMGRALKFLSEGYTFEYLSRQGIIKKIENAEIIDLDFAPLPHNEGYELDLHRPYIDNLELVDEEGKPMARVKEVMDVWFDSGAMPFAQDHYPFEGKDILYPADFISEAVDQTRGWFYTLHAVGALMGRGKAFKNVICLGHLLDKDGKKMSKSLGNVVDPWEMIEKYGVDTLRLWMYSVNQPGESKNFDEKTVSELHSKVFNLLYNVLAFYELYRDPQAEILEYKKSKNILDQWIIARLNQLTTLVTENLDRYKLLEPVRAVREFIDDLSTWYLRRSRERIKDGDKDAKATLYFILKNLAKLLAPFAPFGAEDIWLKLRNESDELSVHLASWPKSGSLDKTIIEAMQKVRDYCNVGNMLRKKENIPVRQPLNELKVKSVKLKEDYIQIIKDELNVKKVTEDIDLGDEVQLDIDITPELKQEGNYRELVRAVQDMRKEMKLTPSDIISLSIKTNKEGEDLINKFKKEFLKTVGARELEFSNTQGVEVKIGDLIFEIKISKC